MHLDPFERFSPVHMPVEDFAVVTGIPLAEILKDGKDGERQIVDHEGETVIRITEETVEDLVLVWKIREQRRFVLDMDAVRKLGRNSRAFDEISGRIALAAHSRRATINDIRRRYARSNSYDVLLSSQSFGEMFRKIGNILRTSVSEERAGRFILPPASK